ncbi:MAG: hypothetical protein ACRDNS_18610, partial [Trebonia sp.]
MTGSAHPVARVPLADSRSWQGAAAARDCSAHRTVVEPTIASATICCSASGGWAVPLRNQIG